MRFGIFSPGKIDILGLDDCASLHTFQDTKLRRDAFEIMLARQSEQSSPSYSMWSQ
jgi:hypothetical protein